MQKTLPTQEEYRQLNRGLTEKVLDRAASDPQWKQQFLDEPEAALREANFPEYQRLVEILQPENTEVSGHFASSEHGSFPVPLTLGPVGWGPDYPQGGDFWTP
jgi:hypothetical protein